MLILFTFLSFLCLISCLGFGFLFCEVNKINHFNKNTGLVGILGLFLLSLIASITHLFLPHGYTHNIILLFLGIISFIFFKKKSEYNFYKIISFIFLLLFIGLLISKNNEDFGYYHLTNSLQFTQHKLQFGLGNLSHGFKHITSLFLTNSIFYFPITEYYLFNITNYLFLVFFITFLIYEIFKNKIINNFSKNLILIVLILFLIKFTRLSEYGTDIAGQILIFISIIISSELYFNKSIKENLKKEIYYINVIIIIFAITTKVVFLIYFLIPLLIFLETRNKKKYFDYIFKIKNLLFIIVPIALLILFNFSSTGCLLYPMKFTCFSNTFDWALSQNTVNAMSNHYELWAKAGKGPTYQVENPEIYLNNFNWLPHWVSNYFFTKVSDFIGVTFITIFFYYIINFNKIKKISKLPIITFSKFFKFYFTFIIIYLFWFLNFPTLRYAGYVIFFLVLSLPFVFYINNKISLSIKNDRKNIYIIIFLCFFIFMSKNVVRINKEFNIPETNHHNFKNFPFFWIDNVNYNKITRDELSVYMVKDGKMCWNTPPTCVRNENFIMKKKYNYKFYYDDQ